MALRAADLEDRDRRIREAAAGGVPDSAIAARYGLTRQRVHQILRAPAAEIGDLNAARRIAAGRLERLRRQRRELDEEIAAVAGFIRELDDEVIVRTNDRILGLS
jgi:hypothetical protein